MDDGGIVLQGLHEVRREGILEQHRHRAISLQVPRGDRLPRTGLSHDDVAETALEIPEIRGQTEDRHDLGGNGDVEAVTARKSVADAAERTDDVTQRPIVHVHHAPPGYAPGIQTEHVALMDVIVEQCGKQVVGSTDGMKIAGEVQIDILHRHHLRVTPAGRTALHPEARTETRLPQAHQRFLADAIQPVRESDRCGGLAFPGRGRCDGGDQHELSVLSPGQRIDVAEIDLRLRVAIRQQRVTGNSQPVSDLRNRLLRRFPCDLDVTLDQRLVLQTRSLTHERPRMRNNVILAAAIWWREHTEYMGYSRSRSVPCEAIAAARSASPIDGVVPDPHCRRHAPRNRESWALYHVTH